MFNSKTVTIAAILFTIIHGSVTLAMNPQAGPADIRVFGLEFPHNQKDDNGNTFWHRLAIASEIAIDWSEMNTMMNDFKKNHKNWMPNPFIVNNNNKTARQRAEDIFNESGNPVSGLVAFYLKQQEDNFLNRMAIKANRDQMAIAQQVEHPNG